MKRLTPEAQKTLFSNVQLCTPEEADMFERHPANRPIKPKHVEVLGNILLTTNRVVTPLLVVKDRSLEGNKLYVIDGQHRLEALKRLNSWFLYIDVTSALAAKAQSPTREDITSFVDRFNIGVSPYTKNQLIDARSVSPFITFYNELAKSRMITLYKAKSKTLEEKSVFEARYPSLPFFEHGLNLLSAAGSKYFSDTPLSEDDKGKMEFLMDLTIAVIDSMGGFRSADNAGVRSALSAFARVNYKRRETFPFNKLTGFIKKKSAGITYENREVYYSALKTQDWLADFVI